ncbi:MAG TPA: 4-alpha-glucanotransferase, partial [Rudaea sp.]
TGATDPAATREAKFIDWAAICAARRRAAERRFDPREQNRNDAFAMFRDREGAALEQHATFEALSLTLREQGVPADWRQWPAALRDPQSREVRDFVRKNGRDIAFHAFLQWLAAEDLTKAQNTARSAGMPIGLICDLAVGVDPGGSECWARPDAMLRGLTIGAPADALGPNGQSWGLTTFSPATLATLQYEPFLALLRAAMCRAGGVRIDHVMGLSRLWLIPEGVSANDGAYLSYPVDDLLRLAALESWRHGCVVVGEDLGTVAPPLRKRLAQRGLLGMDVLLFQRDDEGFFAPSRWRPQAIAMPSTHDTPTVAGWWSERDLEWNARLGFADDAALRRARSERRSARRALAKAARGEGIRLAPDANRSDAVDAALNLVAATPAPLAIVPIEDLIAASDAPNIPGTIDAHPNWKRRYDAPAETLFARPRVRKRLAALAKTRSAP